MNIKDKLIAKRIKQYCSTHLELLDKKDFELGMYMGNYKCHFNAVQKATEDSKNSVILVMSIGDNEQPIVHFINKRGKKFIDNTWGYQYQWFDYYFIKKVSPKEFETIYEILANTKEEIIHQCFSPIERLMFFIGNNEI